MSQFFVNSSSGGGAGGTTQFNEDTGTATPVAGVINVLGGDGITTTGSGNTITISIQNATVDTVVTKDATSQTQILSTVDCSAVGTYFITTQLSAFESTVPGAVGGQLYTTVISDGVTATVVDDTDSVDHRSASMLTVSFSVVTAGTNANVTVVGIGGTTINWGGITVYVYIPTAPP